MRNQNNANWQTHGIQVTKMYQVSRSYFGTKIYTERQLSFRQDSQQDLIRKFNDKKYLVCRPLIAKEIEYKRNNLKRRLYKMLDDVFYDEGRNAKLIELKKRYDLYNYVLDQIKCQNLAA